MNGKFASGAVEQEEASCKNEDEWLRSMLYFCFVVHGKQSRLLHCSIPHLAWFMKTFDLYTC